MALSWKHAPVQLGTAPAGRQLRQLQLVLLFLPPGEVVGWIAPKVGLGSPSRLPVYKGLGSGQGDRAQSLCAAGRGRGSQHPALGLGHP